MQNILEKLRQDIEGVKLLNDWLGPTTDTVGITQAELRTSACTKGYGGLKCPKNLAPNWWNLHENAKSAIAETIRAELELKTHLELRTLADDSLHMCSVCGCCLKLKVWTPIEHIKEHTTQKQLEQYPVWCWIKQEIEK